MASGQNLYTYALLAALLQKRAYHNKHSNACYHRNPEPVKARSRARRKSPYFKSYVPPYLKNNPGYHREYGRALRDTQKAAQLAAAPVTATLITLFFVSCLQKIYIRKNKEHERAKKWHKANPEKQLESSRRSYYKHNKEICARQTERRREDPGFRVLSSMRKRLNKVLKGHTKFSCTRKLVGCSVSALLAHLEKQFRPGMTWENYGPVWHVDHILPCVSFDFSKPEQQKQCFHFSNLQPLFAEENLSKGAKIL